MEVTCKAEANPRPLLTLKRNSEIIKSGSGDVSSVFFIDEFHNKRSVKFACIANNSIGEKMVTSNIDLKDSKYFIVAPILALNFIIFN